MSGRPIKCVVVGDGTGEAMTQNAQFTAVTELEANFIFSWKNMYANIADN